MVKENLATVTKKIEETCMACGRNKDSVKLIAVSKTKPIELIKEAMDFGITDFGENKVQELCSKEELLREAKLNWHLIGTLQRNKVKQVISKAVLIHSVDSRELAEEISKQAVKAGITARILIEINIGEEETKHGISVEEAEAFVDEISKLPAILIKGFMTVAPYTDNPESNRPLFKRMYKLYVDMQRKNADNISISELSMGMSGDYTVAIEEGATMVRVGTGIFGERSYN